ncbi:PadR family transcriptional regulator [Corynebacterium poyangense]|uniref:PadR family transcriptional regulator n=1 Tax=Corynebacterium poyangense TaxID=2684405 RepID=A0A7H0SMZ5_9CORY|nr:PadR family transcriptional regulator [Corynebacterium poyangense]MBZ8176244.1 PadR family transcriptional regulator [Corynebacterium poyangense]QNQ89920.1 PadR family transcriptional regulator [Corynebacterium poyangense]
MAESQLRKGALELIVLGTLEKQSAYGGALVARMNHEAGLEVSSGTLYPLLSRLKKAKLLSTDWEESPSGPPRKIYHITPAGVARLQALYSEWEKLSAVVAWVQAPRRQSEGRE